MTEFIAPVVQESTPSIIADKLRQAIAGGELEPGAQVAEAELARRFGVSRGPLREGMQRLTQEGLLISIRNRGVFVNRMTEQDVRDTYLAREAIERAAARKILQGDPAAAAEALLAIVEEMAAATSPAEINEIDVHFHELLLELAESPRLTRMHQTFIVETRMCVDALTDSYPTPADRVAEHRALAVAIQAGDDQLTDKLLIAHMAEAVDRLVCHLPVS